jgi:hypothetical protein
LVTVTQNLFRRIVDRDSRRKSFTKITAAPYSLARGTGSMKILFIGNSYTGNLVEPFLEMMNEIAPEAVIEFKKTGGWTLAQHVADPATRQIIGSRKWDLVVLQEQSQTPAFSRNTKAYRAHREAIRTLAGWIRDNGARPVLYETWGRCDGDKSSTKRCPDFDAMQALLTAGYADAAAEVDALLVPVGRIWQRVRHADLDLGRSLHDDDGSHASERGSYLIAAAFVRALFGRDAATLNLVPPMSARDSGVLYEALRAFFEEHGQTSGAE